MMGNWMDIQMDLGKNKKVSKKMSEMTVTFQAQQAVMGPMVVVQGGS